FYAPLLMARQGERNGQTWGKQIVGIRAVRDNGQPFELGFGFLREFVVKNLLFVGVGGFFLYIPTIVDWLWPLWDDQNRCLHDMVVSTHVVRA
ncbi:MAG: RDD family protein, partial [Pseudonocardiaceae bacterium]